MERKLKILIVEDSADDARLIERALRTGELKAAAPYLDGGEAGLLSRVMNAMRNEVHAAPGRASEAQEPLRDAAGRPLEIIACMLDVTDRKEAEQALRESEERFRSAFDEAPVGVCLAGRDGRFTRVNRELCRLLGYTEAELLARTFAELTHPDDWERSVAAARALWAGESPSAGLEKRYLRKDGTVMWASTRIALLRGPDGAPYTGIAHIVDITTLKQGEQERRRLARRITRVQEEERRVIAMQLHDELGQAMTAVKLNLQSLRRARGAESLERALADSMAVTEQAIERARSMALELRPQILDDLGLVPALEWYCARQAERARLQIRVEAQVPLPRPSATVALACYRIVQEAVTNALRHAAAKGITVSLALQRESLALEIADDGRGFRSPRRATAPSLGLLGMHERAGDAGGALTVVSAPGTGTRVCAVFPLGVAP